MRIVFFSRGWLACATVAVAAVAQAATPAAPANQTISDQIQVVSHEQYVSMEERLKEMEVRLAGFEAGCGCNTACGDDCCGGGCGDSCCGEPSCGDACCGTAANCSVGCPSCMNAWICPCPAWMFASEFLFLRAQNSEGNESGSDYDFAYRFTLQHVNATGGIWRARYFDYFTRLDQSADPDTLELEYADLEYAKRFGLLGGLRGELSTGLRWAESQEEGAIRYTESIGPVFGLAMQGFKLGPLESYALARHSIQFGHPQNRVDFGSFNITEGQIGLQYTRNSLIVQNYFEAQYWSGAYQGDTQDIGLVGFGGTVGLTF